MGVSNPAAAGRILANMYYVYILKSDRDGNIYTGFSSNLQLRIQQHIEGEVISTKNRRPLKLVYYEAYLNETDARNREKYLKNGGKAKTELKSQIECSLK